MFNKIKNWYIVIIFGVITAMLYNIEKRMDYFESRLDMATGTVSLQMYESIEHWSDSFEIPKYVAYNVAYMETRYKGPFHFDYNPYQKSFAGAVGPMQIITRWAHKYAGKRLTEKELKTNIDLNVRISMQMLKRWHSIHGNWMDAAGAYNSGRPIHNNYAIYVATNKDYKNKWIKL